MKNLLMILGFFVMSVLLAVDDVIADANENLPLPLMEAAAAYKAKGSDEFLPTLVKDSRLQYSNKPLLFQANKMFVAVEKVYGSFQGLELARSVSISASTRIVYFVFTYERGPLYGVADLYMTKEGEIVTNANVNTELKKIIPADVIAKLR